LAVTSRAVVVAVHHLQQERVVPVAVVPAEDLQIVQVVQLQQILVLVAVVPLIFQGHMLAAQVDLVSSSSNSQKLFSLQLLALQRFQELLIKVYQ
jgi:hypothetical protein